jgi:tetratricopeptide (TPR) repeat protein
MNITRPSSIKKSSKLSTLAIFTIATGFLLGLVSCQSSPSKSASPQSPLATPTVHIGQQEDVEQQLLHTLTKARKLGPANPLLLSTMYSLASFYREHQAFGKAERIYQEALLLKEQLHGPQHPDVAIILNQYAALLRDAHRVQEATELEHRARQIQDSLNPHSSPHP